MADNWLTRQLRSFIYGPEPGAIAALSSAPLERREIGYAGRYDLPHPIKLGTLISGPGATQIYRDALGYTDADNSAVAACLNAITRAYNEVPLRHYRRIGKDQAQVIDPSPIAALFHRPNPYMTLRQLRRHWQWCKQSHGNAYLLKLRAGDPLTGEVVELWPVSPTQMTPIRDKGSRNFIDAYRYWPGAGQRYIDFDPANIVHFKMSIDDQNHMLGLSPLRQLLREIATDKRATTFADNLLRNSGAASLVVSYDKEANVSPEDAADVKARLKAEFGGDNAGAIGVLSPGGKADNLGFSPSDMDLTALHRLPEERIAGVLGIPAIIAGLGAGLDRATYANFREAREMFTEQLLIPEWLDDGETLTHQLLPDFAAAADEWLAFDTTEARALQLDEDALYKRLTLAVGGPWLTADEAREEVGRGALTPDQAAALTGADMAVPSATEATATRSLRLVSRKAAGLSEAEIVALLEAARDEAIRELQPAVERHFAGQRRRIVGRMGG